MHPDEVLSLHSAHIEASNCPMAGELRLELHIYLIVYAYALRLMTFLINLFMHPDEVLHSAQRSFEPPQEN